MLTSTSMGKEAKGRKKQLLGSFNFLNYSSIKKNLNLSYDSVLENQQYNYERICFGVGLFLGSKSNIFFINSMISGLIVFARDFSSLIHLFT